MNLDGFLPNRIEQSSFFGQGKWNRKKNIVLIHRLFSGAELGYGNAERPIQMALQHNRLRRFESQKQHHGNRCEQLGR